MGGAPARERQRALRRQLGDGDPAARAVLDVVPAAALAGDLAVRARTCGLAELDRTSTLAVADGAVQVLHRGKPTSLDFKRM